LKNRRKKLFYNEGGEALEQVAQRAGKSLSLGSLKVRLGGALSNLIQWWTSLLTAGALGYLSFNHPFQPKLCYDSMIL